jgi:hypothetical protein
LPAVMMPASLSSMPHTGARMREIERSADSAIKIEDVFLAGHCASSTTRS